MNKQIILKNLNLLKLINLNVKDLIEFHHETRYTPKWNVIKERFKETNEKLNIDEIEHKDLNYILHSSNYNDFFKNTRYEENIRNSELFLKMPSMFMEYIKSSPSLITFHLYQSKKLFTILDNLVLDCDFKALLGKTTEKMQYEYIDYLIETKSSVIFTKTNGDIINQYKRLSLFTSFPEKIEKYIAETNNKLLLKITKEYNIELVVNTLLSNPYTIKRAFMNGMLKEEEKELLFKKMETRHLRREFIEYIPEEKRFELLNKLNAEDLKKMIWTKELKNDFFVKNIDKNLFLLNEMEIETLNKYYKEIRKSILNGIKTGKQGLKYFLIKNKKRLDKELLEFVLKKYPRFFNSLKIKEEINFNTEPFKKEKKLKDVIYNQKITNEDIKFVKQNLKALMKITNLNNLNKEVEKIMLEEIYRTN